MSQTDLAKRLRVYRAEHDLTQAALGLKLGADHAHISRMESGTAKPTKKQVAKMIKCGILQKAVA